MSDIIKIIDQRERQKKKKKTKQDKQNIKIERIEGDGSYKGHVKARLKYCVFKLGFLELICKAY